MEVTGMKKQMNNHELLAEKIYEIENADWKQKKEWYKAGIK